MTRIDFDVIRQNRLLEISFRCYKCGETDWLVLEKIEEDEPFSDDNSKLVCMPCHEHEEKLHIVSLIYSLLDSLTPQKDGLTNEFLVLH